MVRQRPTSAQIPYDLDVLQLLSPQSMSILEGVTLLGIMTALAATPSTSVALVVTRSITSGIRNGLAVAAGIVLGDLCFITFAIFGLSTIAHTMASIFLTIKYCGAVYLLWLGFSLFRQNPSLTVFTTSTDKSGHLIASFLAGAALTLGDVKAIFFYISLFPTFITVDALQPIDILMLYLITLVSVGGVKTAYALSANKIAALAKGKHIQRITQLTAASLMVGAGLYILVRG